MKGGNEIRIKIRASKEMSKIEKRTPSRQNYLEGQTKFHSQLKALLSFPMNLSRSLSLLGSLSLMLRAFQALFSATTEQWMHVSHATQPRHRWTRHSQRHLTLSAPPPLHSSHGTWACRARREGVNFPSQSGSDSWVFHKRTKTLGINIVSFQNDLSCKKMVIRTCKRHIFK